MKALLLPALVAFLLTFVACSGPAVQDKAVAGIERVEMEEVVTSGEPLATADFAIEGMSCEMMCGGSIKKALAGLGAVSTEIKMDEEGPDHAIVTYDAAKLNDAQMVEAIQALYDGQYKVISIAVTKRVKGEGSVTGSEGASSAQARSDLGRISAREVVLPSVLAILSRLLRF
ncbi:MAG: heavy-metal-associated domain-containing protein [Flavobacteriales bacterium]|jgi:copper chaperone CopZ|nr:MAG: heavy-metal-associated domain-containing protein [Flavobacteriales bacterium]